MSTSRMTLFAGLTLIPQSLKDQLCVLLLMTSSTMWMNTCHMQLEQAITMNDRDEPRTMFSFPIGFDEMDAIFHKFGTCAVSTLRVGAHIAVNGRIPMMIAPDAENPISLHVVRFSQTIGVCVRKIFPVCYLKWADVGREYIEVVKADLQNQMLELQSQPTSKGTQLLFEDEICETILGRRLGYSKGLG
ncbi:CACTA en-spm transposon protein [Cucumis melo var. makuwa]|uniref:CACTA en-spm transposon protein n=1 Tax=Cucumis melo var. makuwa TaxID=1194695 RepID=A0A5D3BC22_CUCMM|nr:CACTA en-spm transposon protein [Cucumis melo var. makuwa]TYJ96677.1 CACTA en-spm transposon protein [Cucumis melo var. makuwa]